TDPVDRASAIDCLRADGIRLHEKLVVTLLDHESEYIRASAIATVLKWDGPRYVPLATDRLENDPSTLVRSLVALSLGFVAFENNKFALDIMRTLVKAIDQDAHQGTRVTAYGSVAMYSSGTYRRPVLDPRTFDLDRDADKALLARFRSAARKTAAS